MTTLTPTELGEALRAIKGARALTITALTDTRARKTGNPWSEILKLSRVNGMTGVHYAAAVERRQALEHQPVGFEAREPWYERVCGTLGQHLKTGELYLLIKPERVLDRPTYFGRNPNSGVLVQVPKAAVEPFLPVHRSAAPAQGTLTEVPWRTYALRNIVSAVLDGTLYRIRAPRATVIPAPVPITARKPSRLESREPRSQVPGGYEPPETGCR